jgi:hypothetical protein
VLGVARAACFGLLAALLLSPAPDDGPVWVRRTATPTSYVARCEAVHGVVRLPKLVPPAGATVIVQAVGGGLADDRVRWTTPPTPWSPGPQSEVSVWLFASLRAVEGGSIVPMVGGCALSGVAERYDLGTTYPASTSGSSRVTASTFSAGSPLVFSASGAPISIEITPSWSLNQPTPMMTADHSETYSLDLLVSW